MNVEKNRNQLNTIYVNQDLFLFTTKKNDKMRETKKKIWSIKFESIDWRDNESTNENEIVSFAFRRHKFRGHGFIIGYNFEYWWGCSPVQSKN